MHSDIRPVVGVTGLEPVTLSLAQCVLVTTSVWHQGTTAARAIMGDRWPCGQAAGGSAAAAASKDLGATGWAKVP